MSHLTALARVAFDLSVFKRVAAQRTSRTFGFLLILVLLSTLAATLSTMRVLHELARKADPYLDKLPTVTIKDGKASADVPQPWVKKFDDDEHGRAVVLIIDTTGQRTDFEANEVGLFVQREQLIMKSEDQRREVPLSQVPDMVVGPKTVRGMTHKILTRAPFWIGAVLLVYYFLAKLMQGLILVLTGLIGASGRKHPLGFGALFTVGVYALAPAVLLDCVTDLLPFSVPHFWLIYLALAATYSVLGARAASDEADAPTP
jgi:hypothetical protein